MTNTTNTRMLLSHNFDLGESNIPALSRAAFTAVFTIALQDCAQCREVDNPHWIVEVLFDATQLTPAQMGDRLVNALAEFRRSTLDESMTMPEFVVLGGLKTSPPTSSSPDALQPNQWGVDVVETPIVAAFLAGLNWEAAIADRPPEGIFKSVIRGES